MRRSKSFTLIEILVVATIIVLLAGAAAVSYSELNKKSRNAKRKADLEQIRLALELFRDEVGRYPVSSVFYNFCSDNNPIPNHIFYAKYLRKPPKDPKCPDYTYGYRPTRGDGITDCQNRLNPLDYSTWCQDYTLGAFLEGESSTCSAEINCGIRNCNYCVGPMGKK